MKKNILALLFAIVLISCKKENTFYTEKFALGLEKTISDEVVGLQEQLDFNVGPLPTSSVLNMPPIGSQGKQGSCTSWAITYAMLSYHRNLITGSGYSSNNSLFSPTFSYNQITQGNCRGTSIPQTMSLVCNKGGISLSSMSYNETNCSIQPTSSQLSTALANKMTSYKWVNASNVNRLKTCIIAKKPVCIAIEIFTSFYELKPPFILKSLAGTSYGWHAIVIVGYDNSKNAFKVQNSWGSNWADGGYFWLDYNLVQNAILDKWGFIFI